MKGNVIIISGPSGVGKSTLVNDILSWGEVVHPGRLKLSVSYTTRTKKPGEVDGVDYNYVTKRMFERLIAENAMIEWAQVYDNYYGTNSHDLTRAIDSGISVILEIDIKGARQIRQKYPNSTSIFMLPPSIDILKNRIMSRMRDTEAEVEQRLAHAEEELAASHEYTHSCINEDRSKCESELISLIKPLLS